MYSPSLREKRTRFSLSAILIHVTHQSPTTATTAPTTGTTAIPATTLRWLLLLLLLLVHIAAIFLLITTVVSPLLGTHVPVLLTSTTPHVSVERHLLVVSPWLLLLLTIHPVLRGERRQELGELLGGHIPQPGGHCGHHVRFHRRKGSVRIFAHSHRSGSAVLIVVECSRRCFRRRGSRPEY